MRQPRLALGPRQRRRGRRGVRGRCQGGRRLSGLRVPLHVPEQVRLLRVALSAPGADVRLEVLGVPMARDVLQEGVLVGKALVAGVALEGLVRLVAARVRLEVGQLREGLVAARVPAQVRLVACVRAHVLLQVRQLGELAVAQVAAVRLHARVDAGVLGQVGRVGKRLATLRAPVRLGLPQVALRVQLQLCLGVKHLWAHLALVLSGLRRVAMGCSVGSGRAVGRFERLRRGQHRTGRAGRRRRAAA